MRFGHFDDERREYVIDRPDTPLPWINYLGTESYFGIISNTAGGYSFYRDARLRRLTRYRYNNAPFDFGGRYLYLRDAGSGEYWSPTWQPTQTELDEYECRHGLSYTQIASGYKGIKAKVSYFVPLGETLEVWRLQLTNERESAAELSVFSSVEFALWDAQDDATNYQRNFNTGQVEVEDGVIYHKTEYRERRDHFAYFACSEPLAGFDTQREAFLGPYRAWDRPIAVERGTSSDSVAHGWQPHGSHHVRITLEPGESREIGFVLGYWENPKDAKFDPPGSQTINKQTVRPVIERWLQQETVDAGFAALRANWDRLLGTLQVHTPDGDTNRMVNIWNAYQNMVTFNMSRSTSGFETGIGRGMGFRDSNQDLLGFVHMIPERARERILDIAATQLSTGGAYHQYQPLTKRGNNDIGSGFNDDPLWLILGVAAYLKESGDLSILDAPVPYDNEAGSEQPLYDHLQRSLQYTLDRLGPHGLPLIGRADWNDCLNLNCFSDTPGEPFQTTENATGGVAESVFIAGQFVLAAKELAGIAQCVGKPHQEYLDAAEKMAGTIAEHGWDGAWFRRAYDFYGNVIGSASNDEGQIFVEPQGMCIMGGVGVEDGLAVKALASVRERLATPHGVVLQQPAYSSYRLELGEISSYPPGYKENAGIFCHTNPWIMIAEAIVGNGDAAFDYYRRILPSAREAISEVHRCEPYVYAQMIAGKDAPTHGEAKNSWLTGTAAYNFTAISQWILGIRPELTGLRVDPVIPSDWPGFTAVRQFRGATYRISVTRGAVRALSVDGQDFDPAGVLPLAPEGSVVEVNLTVS
ncbi:GH36-type glycosyl hydrolase domain-containing protein [Dactylosporangium matsuzakiense]|uniref:Glycosyl transferase n=1 Tax=Dactylosporangium matsuzakiense TaxID=53360 RepID=A0A9W6KFW4_9ACTN|nr:glycosyl transferase [Dactylosporangium matsuzakiense]UWZ46556.1 glycosyl transferase [Dactylosporangium matsuzakiense]GLL01322.1 glycosyl transferase [Dactylosporangium matsuzakiense]